jgi:hypothetical protein
LFGLLQTGLCLPSAQVGLIKILALFTAQLGRQICPRKTANGQFSSAGFKDGSLRLNE